MELNNKDLISDTVTGDKEVSLQIKKPKKILHFCDGTLEEFSDDEDDIDGSVAGTEENGSQNEQASIDEKNLPWIPWLKVKSWKTGTSALAGIDYVGSILADFLGITTPKFALEYEAFKQNQNEKAEIEKEKLENASWQENQNNSNEIISTDLKSDSSIRF
ncbi:protein FAM177A1 [Condylostylus longicornis]|uniref:protein FAM177A1 n=1 Tax=Condylostylus longicornis TaxID=2530218 RepID=UPI00244E1A12|nr:protein FAM177A1 [Condylostylus longicornis]